MLAVRVLRRLLAVLRLLSELGLLRGAVGLLLRGLLTVRLLARLLAVRVLRGLLLAVLLLRSAVGLLLLRGLLAELRGLAELRLPGGLLLRAAVRLAGLRRILLPALGSLAPGERGLRLRAGAAGLRAGRLALVAQGRDRPLGGRGLGGLLLG